MRRLAVLAVILVAGLAGSAAADGGYGGVGIGVGADLGGELAEAYDADGEVAGRIIGGTRSGPLAVEAVFFGTDLHGEAGGKFSTFSLAVDFKLFAPLLPYLDGYVRAGLGRTWLSGAVGNASRQQPAGEGDFGQSWQYGGGLQLVLRTPVVAGALYADWNHEEVRLHGDRGTTSGSIEMLTFGFLIGSTL